MSGSNPTITKVDKWGWPL